jgi:hypothetical protein
MAAIIIGSVDTTPAPKRIVLGSDSYGIILNALTQRLADIEPQKRTCRFDRLRHHAGRAEVVGDDHCTE